MKPLFSHDTSCLSRKCVEPLPLSERTVESAEHEGSLSISTQKLLVMSQPCDPSVHAWGVGICVGALLGVPVGANVGASEGVAEGASVGAGVIATDGSAVGNSEGVAVGEKDGCLDGWAVGLSVDKQLVSLEGSTRKPSKQAHLYGVTAVET
jgi:hypothetical protein